MRRRSVIQALFAVAGSGLYGCRKQDLRAEVLRSVIERVVVPNTAAAAESSRNLERQLSSLTAPPSLAELRAVRQAWQRALLSWKRLDAFRLGPILESNSLLRAMFWPVRAAGIEALLQGSQPLDEASVDAMGVDRRGLFALEFLLFGDESDESFVARFSGAAGARRAQLARALAGNVSSYASKVSQSLGNGQKYAEQFAEAGPESLNRLIAQQALNAENVLVQRLVRTASLAKSRALEPPVIEGGPGRVSQLIALTYLRATEELYLAGNQGLCRLVQSRSSVVDGELRSAFADAIAAVSELGAPLEEVALRDPTKLDAAALAVKKLERALKVDLASLLGVTVSFTSVDGD